MLKRKNRFSLFPSVIGVGGLVGLVGSAHADSTVTQSQAWNLMDSDSVESLTFDNFNPALGALDSVTIGGDFTINGTLYIFDGGSSPVSFNHGYVSEPITASGAFAEQLNQTAVVDGMSGTVNPYQLGTYTASSPDTALNAISIINPSEFGAFESLTTPTFSVVLNVGVGNVSQGASFYGANKSDGWSDGSAAVSGNLTVTYAYNTGGGGILGPKSVPEPATASAVLVGGALGSAALLRRRRRGKRLS